MSPSYTVMQWTIANSYYGRGKSQDFEAVVENKRFIPQIPSRQFHVGLDEAQQMGIPPGEYNHTGITKEGLWVYRKAANNG